MYWFLTGEQAMGRNMTSIHRGPGDVGENWQAGIKKYETGKNWEIDRSKWVFYICHIIENIWSADWKTLWTLS